VPVPWSARLTSAQLRARNQGISSCRQAVDARVHRRLRVEQAGSVTGSLLVAQWPGQRIGQRAARTGAVMVGVLGEPGGQFTQGSGLNAAHGVP